jgi:hypothetical protein
LCLCSVQQQHHLGFPQDVAAAHSKVSARVFPLAGLLGRQLQPLQRLPGSINSSISSAAQRAALRRLQHRAQQAGVDAFELIVNGDLQQWESMVCASLAAGMSLEVAPSSAQDQVGSAAGTQFSVVMVCCCQPILQFVQELRLALWLGRTLALHSEEQVSCKRHIEYKDADGRVQQLQVR